jgi:hypothetical protein
MTKPQKDTNSDEATNSFLISILEDCGSITIEEDGISIVKKANSTTLNA